MSPNFDIEETSSNRFPFPDDDVEPELEIDEETPWWLAGIDARTDCE